MGCCAASRMQRTVEQHRGVAYQQEALKSSAPFISSKGEVIIPMNGMTGEFAAAFPVWLKGRISSVEYQVIIGKLNNITMPVFSNMIQESDEMIRDVADIMGAIVAATTNTSAMNIQLFRMKKKVEAVLDEENKNLLKSKGLKMSSMLNEYANKNKRKGRQRRLLIQDNMINMGLLDANANKRTLANEKGIKIIIDEDFVAANDKNNNNNNNSTNGDKNNSNINNKSGAACPSDVPACDTKKETADQGEENETSYHLLE